ncbi:MULTISPECIES: hypothetical protein [Burkholderia cepacia complex]|jgi:hypothetical protein|uniref:hypothetical protein n=1 Tax=Burkholderia cepacia complex TaxID=87882 RepID=UPI00158891CB|nr:MULTISPECIES: hypothetical protein [Burkholderia cepacia complex]MCA8037049.1 hypothetical protein [Burkholderia arboris]
MPKRARSTPYANPALERITSARRDAERLAARDLARREADAAKILFPNEVSGEYTAERGLTTTLNGQKRAITLDDLRAFQQYVKNAKGKFKAGITAQAVIDLSLQVDRDRANEQIRTAVPAQIRGAQVHFITNAGPDSDRVRHHVHVRFLNFDAVVAASPNDPKRIGRMVTTGPLLFDCDCGRHTYWYRYIATIGKFNEGRNETGYPKVRNPRLVGVACKHVLRVMDTLLRNRAVQLKVAQSVLTARTSLDRSKVKTERVKVSELREIAEHQETRRRATSDLRTTAVKKQDSAMRKARADMKRSAEERAAKAAKTDQRAAAKAARELEKNMRTLIGLGRVTEAELAALMEKIR